MSLGGEIKSSYLELNYNQYFSNSDSKTGKNSKAEEALDGYDLEFGAQIPYIPSSTFYTKAFKFDVPSGNDFEGYEYTTKVEVPNSGLIFELGHTNYDHHTDEWFLQLRFSTNKVNKDREFISDEVFEKTSIVDQKYDKVRRENIIVKSGSAFTVKAGGF
jgi:adhesin/invasin